MTLSIVRLPSKYQNRHKELDAIVSSGTASDFLLIPRGMLYERLRNL
jgi:hypothetical protein